MNKIQRLCAADSEEIASLSARVFIDQVLPSYIGQGRVDTLRYLQKKADLLYGQIDCGRRVAFGCFHDKQLTGIAVVEGNHIVLLYVTQTKQGLGIGKALMAYCKGYISCKYGVVTVDASDFALEFYRRCDFHPTNYRQINGGVVYTPMKCNLKR